MSQINVDKIVSLTGGVGSPEIQLESGGGFKFDNGTLYIDSANNEIGINTTTPRASLDIAATDGMIVPVGTTAERPTTPIEGTFRYNSTDRTFEGYSYSEDAGAVQWGPIAGAGGVPAQSVDRYSTDYSVSAVLKSDGTETYWSFRWWQP